MTNTKILNDNNKVRPELRCISVPSPIWGMAVELADEASTSVSALLRALIKKAYKRNKVALVQQPTAD